MPSIIKNILRLKADPKEKIPRGFKWSLTEDEYGRLVYNILTADDKNAMSFTAIDNISHLATNIKEFLRRSDKFSVTEIWQANQIGLISHIVLERYDQTSFNIQVLDFNIPDPRVADASFTVYPRQDVLNVIPRKERLPKEASYFFAASVISYRQGINAGELALRFGDLVVPAEQYRLLVEQNPGYASSILGNTYEIQDLGAGYYSYKNQ